MAGEAPTRRNPPLLSREAVPTGAMTADVSLVSSLSSLIAQLVPSLGDPAEDSRVERLLQLCLRIVSSRMAGSTAPSDAAAAEATRRRLVQVGRATDALSFSELNGRLMRAPELRKPAAALQLLASLLGSADSSALGSAGVHAALLARPPVALASGVIRAPEPATTPSPPNGHTPAAPSGDGTGAPPVPRRGWEIGGAGELGERALVRELLFVMQNIDGAHLKWDERRDAFHLPATAKVPPGARQLVGRLSELGWLFRQVTSYVKGGGEGGTAGGGGSVVSGFESGGEASVRAEGGLVAQALRHALQEELDEWFQLIAVLEEQRQTELTLLQLLVWSVEPMQRLLLMAQLTRGSGHLKGGAMTVAIARQENHGDPAISGYVRHLLRAACMPLFAMTKEWLLHGQVTDAYDEFFIEQRAVPLSELWEGRYLVREAMLPCFLSRPLATEVLNVGKALNFIRLCCGDTGWSLRLNSPLSSETNGASRAAGGGAGGDAGSGGVASAASAASLIARLEYGREAELQSVVRRASALANAHLLDQLMNHFELRAHCFNTQQYLLLGKGDFVQSLMEHLAPQLARPANQLHRHHLLSLVESAVRSSAPTASETHPSEALLLKSLDVTLAKVPGGSGWDCFCLDYNVGSPVDVVFSSSAMRSYRQVSTFLWRLKRVEHSLTAVWRKHCTTARLIPRLHREPTMHGCYLLRNEMVHFVYNMQYYLMFEVIECASVEFAEQLNAATDLDMVLNSHARFLGSIETKAMLRPEDEEMHRALKELFDAILQFARAQDVLYMSLLEQKASARQHAASVKSSASSAVWGAVGDVSDSQLGGVTVEPRLTEQLLAAASDYKRRFGTFFALVREHASYDLAFLAFRLDFNEYYESLAAEAAAENPEFEGDVPPTP